MPSRPERHQQLRSSRQERDAARHQADERRESFVDSLHNLVGSSRGSEHSEAEAEAYQRRAWIEREESRAEAVLNEERKPVIPKLDPDGSPENPIKEFASNLNQDLTNKSSRDPRLALAVTKLSKNREDLNTCLRSTSCFSSAADSLISILHQTRAKLCDQQRAKRQANQVVHLYEIEPPRQPDGNHGRLTTEILAVFEGNIKAIQASLYSPEDDDARYGLMALEYLLSMGDELQRRLANAVLKQHNERICTLARRHDTFTIAQFISFSDEEAATCLSTRIGDDMITSKFHPNQVSGLISSEMSDLMPESTHQRGREHVQRLLEQYGLNYDKLLVIWQEAAPSHWDESAVVLRNLESLCRLEQTRPGSSKRLFDRFGIAVFGRYPIELLVEQDELADDNNLPYGTVTYARKDQGIFDGALYEAEPALRSIWEQLQGKFHVRVIEAEGPISLVKRHIGLDKDYGGHQKMSFGIQFAHGSPNSMIYGANQAGTLKQAHLVGRAAQRVLACYASEAQHVLISCSTGVEEGMAQNISKQSGQLVSGPDRNVTIDRAEVTVSFTESGLPRFTINYRKRGGEQKEFLGGSLAN